jgi:predicted metal-binding membrane protein
MSIESPTGGRAGAAPAIRPAIAWQRNLILATLLILAAAGWVVFLNQARDASHMDSMQMDRVMMSSPDLTMGRAAPLFLGMWIAMMVAMMFPAAAPMVVTYARMPRPRRGSIALFTGSYIALWFVFGALAYLLGAGVETLVSRSEWFGMNWGRAGGALLVLAGLYQLSPLKDVCLRHCRAPVAFVMEHWRGGEIGAVRMGFRHGLYCFGCCWLLFLVLVPIGVMNVAAMAAVALVVFAEKVTPWGRSVSRLAALGLVAYGAIVLFRPTALPTVG